jgi:hypothetical protein
MKNYLLVLLLIVASIIPACATAGQANFTWRDYSLDWPEDYPSLHATEAYEIQMGVTSGNYTATFKIPRDTNGIPNTTYSVKVPNGKYFAVIRAKTADGIYSDYSTEVSRIVKPGSMNNFDFK